MKRQSKLYASIALGALIVAGTSRARADDTAAEIALLKAQLRRLEQRVAAQGRETDETRAAVKVAAAHPIYTKGPLPVLASTCPPDKFCYKGVTITPGGFLALESVYRDHNQASDIGTPFGSIPFGNSRVGRADEFRFSARQSRVSALIEGNVDPATKLSGYFELDFLGAAQTANSNESNSYNPRIRHIYATVDNSEFGVHILAGQTWSLATMSAVGMLPRKENIPLTIDAQYVPGFVWARQPQIRFVKDVNPELQVGLSVENPQTTESGNLPANFNFNQAAVGGGLFNSANNLSLNHVPDVVGKVAWDPKFGDRTVHVEAWGLGRDFYARYNGKNEDAYGGAAGGSVLVPVVPKIVDAQFSGAYGQGLGRYGTSGLPDITVSPTGAVKPLSEVSMLAGLTWHATPMLDVYGYAGMEKDDRKTFNGTVGGVAYGYGNPLLLNLNCNVEGTATCAGNTREVRQATIGIWDTIYKGGYGQLRAGAQYSYTERKLFADVAGRAPSTSENIVLTSLRYYPF